MLLSKPTQYAIRVLLYLATQPGGEYVPVRVLAQELRLPLPTLSKIIHTLARHRLVQTVKGRSGGVMLAHLPQNIDLMTILNVSEGPDVFGDCLLGSHDCLSMNNCAVHIEWAPIKEQLEEKFGKLTLTDLRKDCNSLQL